MKTAGWMGWVVVLNVACGAPEVKEAAMIPAPPTAVESAPAATPEDAGPPNPERRECGPSGIVGADGRCVTCPKPDIPGPVQLLRTRKAPQPSVSSTPASVGLNPTIRNTRLTAARQLKAHVAAQPLAAPARARELRQLGDAWVEIEAGAASEKGRAEIARDAARDLGRHGDQLREEANAENAAKLEKLARAEAIAAFRTLCEDYAGEPSAHFPTAPPPVFVNLDQVFHLLAVEQQLAGDGTSARKARFELIKRFPASPYVADSYLAFGDYFFDEAASDPAKWPLARQAYEKVIVATPAPHRLAAYAWYKLAYVHVNLAEDRQALEAFLKVLEITQQNPSGTGAAALARAARQDVVSVYAISSDPKGAYDFALRVSGDPAGALEMAAKIAEAYRDRGSFAEAVVLYRDLLARSTESDDRRCVYHNKAREILFSLGRREACPECATP